MKSKKHRISPRRAGSIAALAATWIFSVAVLGSPAVERHADSSESPALVRMVEKTDRASSNSTGRHSFASIGSITVTGLAMAALALPFGLCNVSLLRRTMTLGSRVRHLATPTIQSNSERAPEAHDLLFQGTK